jgi:hypothetical protein
MSRDSIRKQYGQFKEFKKNKFSKNTADDFTTFHIYYDMSNKVEAVEFFSGVELDFKGKNLTAMYYNDLIQFAKSNSFTCKEIGAGSVIIEDIGVSINAPEKTNIESILVYRRGYYDFLNKV